MILIGFKEDSTGVGHSESNHSIVQHQRTDVLAIGTEKDLKRHYETLVKKGQESRLKLIELENNMEFIDMDDREYEKLYSKYQKDIQILKYDKVLIIEGTVLKQ